MSRKWKTAGITLLLCLLFAVTFGLALADVRPAEESVFEGAALFRAEKGAEIGDIVDIPEYMGESYIGGKEGVAVKFTENNAKVRFNGIIDLKKLEGESFIELQVTPQNNRYKEVNFLYLTLTDVYDENNFVTIRLMAGDATGMVYSQYTYVSAAPNGLGEPLGEVINAWGFGNTGSAMCTTFYGNMNVMTPQSLELSYDTEKDAVYGEKSDYWANPKFCVIDFDDSRLGGIFSSFGGFTSGEVYLTLEAEGLVASEATVLIQSLNGYAVRDLLEDEGETVISVNNGGAEEYDDAIKGGYYEILPAVAYNRVREFDVPVAKVYRGAERVPVAVNDGFFDTDFAGEYYIEYEVTNRFVKTVRSFTLHVRESYETPLTYEISDKIDAQAFLNENIILYSGTAAGGIGALKEEVSVALNGENVELGRNGRYHCFTPDKTGVYAVTFTVSDERGGSVSETIEIDVQAQEKPAFDEPYLPKVMIAEIPYVFPGVNAYYETADGSEAVRTEILVNGEDYSGKTFVPERDFEVTYKVSAANDAENFVQKTYAVRVLAPQTFSLENYFLTENVNGSLQVSGYLCEADGADGNIEFIKAIPSRSLSISLSVPKEQNNFSAVSVKLIDAADPSSTLSLRIQKSEVRNGYSDFCLNGEFAAQINGDFYGNPTALTLRYDAENRTFTDDLYKTLCTVDYTEDGSAFDGFSEWVYAVIGIEGVQGDAGIYIQRICNQSFSKDITYDNGSPIIVQDTTLPFFMTATMGQTILIGTAKAYDVLSAVKSCTLTVTAPDGRKLYSGNSDAPYELQIETVGLYKAVYTATDTSGKKEDFTCRISVFDETPPVITVDGSDVPEKVQAGDTVELPSGEVHDESDENVRLYRYMDEPKGYTRLLSGTSYTFKEKGTYILKYYSVDKDGNFSIVSFTIKCV